MKEVKTQKNPETQKTSQKVSRSEVAKKAWAKRRENHGKTGISEKGHIAITLKLKRDLKNEEKKDLEKRYKEIVQAQELVNKVE